MKKSIAALLAVCALSLGTAQALAKDKAPKKKLDPVIHVCKKNDSSVNVLACNIYHEARGESLIGQLAVGFVTLNRLKDERFPQSVRKVVYQESQFSWTKTTTNVRDKKSWKVAKDIANFLYVMKRSPNLYDMMDPTYGSTYFHTRHVKPYWKKYFTKVITIDNHVFYKPKEEQTI